MPVEKQDGEERKQRESSAGKKQRTNPEFSSSMRTVMSSEQEKNKTLKTFRDLEEAGKISYSTWDGAPVSACKGKMTTETAKGQKLQNHHTNRGLDYSGRRQV